MVSVVVLSDIFGGLWLYWLCFSVGGFFFFQAEDGIRDLVRSRGLGDVYKRQVQAVALCFRADGNLLLQYAKVEHGFEVLSALLALSLIHI